MNPSTAVSAGRQASFLGKKQFSGIANATARRRIARADSIGQTIWKRWSVGIYDWKLKHVRWYLRRGTLEPVDSALGVGFETNSKPSNGTSTMAGPLAFLQP